MTINLCRRPVSETRLCSVAIGLVKLTAITVFLAALAIAAPNKTVWDGVYTTAQAERGKAAYGLHCQLCHAEDMSGGADGDDPAPALRQNEFAQNRKDLNNLYSYIKASMPRDEPGSLDGRTTINIVAYLLQQNLFPAGAEEFQPDPEALKGISTVKKPR